MACTCEMINSFSRIVVSTSIFRSLLGPRPTTSWGDAIHMVVVLDYIVAIYLNAKEPETDEEENVSYRFECK